MSPCTCVLARSWQICHDVRDEVRGRGRRSVKNYFCLQIGSNATNISISHFHWNQTIRCCVTCCIRVGRLMFAYRAVHSYQVSHIGHPYSSCWLQNIKLRNAERDWFRVSLNLATVHFSWRMIQCSVSKQRCHFSGVEAEDIPRRLSI